MCCEKDLNIQNEVVFVTLKNSLLLYFNELVNCISTMLFVADFKKVADRQCDQISKWFAQHLVINRNKSLPNTVKLLQT